MWDHTVPTVTVCNWLFSFQYMSWNLVHSNYHGSTQSFQWLYKIFFQAPRAGHLACFQFFTTISKAVRISAHTFGCIDFISLSCFPVLLSEPLQGSWNILQLLRCGGIALVLWVCRSPLPCCCVTVSDSPSQAPPGTVLSSWNDKIPLVPRETCISFPGLLGKQNRILSQV